MDEFGEFCKKRFNRYVDDMHVSAYHSLKRKYRDQAEAVLDVYLDHLALLESEGIPDFGDALDMRNAT